MATKKALKNTVSPVVITKATKLVPDATPLNLAEAAKRNKHHSYFDDGSNMSDEQKLAVANATSLMSEAHAVVVSGARQTERGRAYITATMVSMIRLDLVPPLPKAVLDSPKGRTAWLTTFCEVIGQDYEMFQTEARTKSEERAYVQALRDSQVTAALLLKRNMIAFDYVNDPKNAAVLGEHRSIGLNKSGLFVLNKAKLPGIVEGSGVSGTDTFSISAIAKMARKGESNSTGDTMLLRRINSLKEELNKATLTKLTSLERNALNLLAVSIQNCITRVDAQNAADKANAEKVAKSKADSAARAAAAHAAKMAKDKAA